MRLLEVKRSGKEIHILYFGNFDPSGDDMDDQLDNAFRYCLSLLSGPVVHTFVFCQFKLSFKFFITYSALEFLSTENIKFHTIIARIEVHINSHTSQELILAQSIVTGVPP